MKPYEERVIPSGWKRDEFINWCKDWDLIIGKLNNCGIDLSAIKLIDGGRDKNGTA